MLYFLKIVKYNLCFNYILLIMLLHLSWFFPLCPLSTQQPTLPQAIPPVLFMSMGPGYVFWPLHFLYCTLHPHGYSVTTYLYFLILSPLYPFPYSPLPSGSHQNALCIHVSVSVLFCLVCFLVSIVDGFIFLAILMFIALIFFFVNKSL